MLIELAGIPAEVICRHPVNEEFLKDYVTEKASLISIVPTDEDLTKIQAGIDRVDKAEGRPPRKRSGAFLENNAIHALLAEKLVDFGVLLVHGSALCMDGKVYILELGARSGGSLIPQVTALATGVDMVPYVIKAAMGEDCSDLKMAPVKGFWSNYMAHSNETGLYAGIEYSEEFGKRHLVVFVTDTNIGNPVHKYRDAQDCVGELILKYENQEEMFNVIENMDRYFMIKTK